MTDIRKDHAEVVIATEDWNADSSSAVNEADCLERKEKAVINFVDVHTLLEKVRGMALDPACPIKVTDEEKISELASLCDQIYYWGLAESRFPNDNSVLAECDTVKLLIDLLQHDRAAIVISAFRCLGVVLMHRICLHLFLKFRGPFSSSTAENPCSSCHDVVFQAMRRFPNKEDIQVLAIIVVRLVAVGDIESALGSELISGVLAAMKQHGRNVDIQKEGCFLFASIVDLPRHNPCEVPLAIILCHVGVVAKFVMDAHKLQPTSSELCAAIAKLARVLSEPPQNREAIVNANAIQVCCKIMSSSLYAPMTMSDALTAVAQMVTEMDNLQKRSIALIAKNIMMKTSDVKILSPCYALITVIVQSVNQPRFEPSHSSDQQDDGGVSREDNTPLKDARTEEEKQSDSNVERELKLFLTQQQVPQLISIGREHFKEDPLLVATAEQALRSLVVRMW